MQVKRIIFNSLAAEYSKDVENAEKIMIGENGAYQTPVSKYVLNNYKKSNYYRCNKCGRLTPRNVHNACPQDGCDGVLELANPDEVLKDNYYRNEYKTKKIERIVVKEHTAQLKRDVAKQFQNDFRDKKINILSCSTTFEMGIDLGGLETVFMRNVPPTAANYVQRAGRAGRRKDSSAYVLTYCGTGSHDYTYFKEPEKMISGIINPPLFNVMNEKIIYRHLMAVCLSYFFKNNPEYFRSVDGLVFDDGETKLNTYLSDHPKEIINFIDKKVIPESKYEKYHNFNWYTHVEGEDEKLHNFIDTIRGLSKEYEDCLEEAKQSGKYDDAAYYQRRIDELHKLNVIQTLSKYCVIPKYGFPVDVVDLETYNDKGFIEKTNDLSRDLSVAISEYAPDSEVIANKKKYTSKYVTLPKTGTFPKHFYCECPICHKINVAVSANKLIECSCGASLENEEKNYFIEPVYGFKTGITKETSRMKPKRSYSGEVTYLSEGVKDENVVEFGEISVEYSSNAELLVMNKSFFYMCPECGYGEIIKGKPNTPKITIKHKNYRQFDCVNDKLDSLKLGHTFKTDIARMTLKSIKIDDDDAVSKALSFLYAFLEGMSIGLEIERNDINGIIEMNEEEDCFDILLFDNVPGGAGHVKRIMNRDSIIKVLQNALFKVSQDCCDESTSCYNCLRNYNNQSYHSKLKRKYAKEVLIKSLKDY